MVGCLHKKGAVRSLLDTHFEPESKPGRMEHILSRLVVVSDRVLMLLLLSNSFKYF